jgi:hypothetical protein
MIGFSDLIIGQPNVFLYKKNTWCSHSERVTTPNIIKPDFFAFYIVNDYPIST